MEGFFFDLVSRPPRTVKGKYVTRNSLLARVWRDPTIIYHGVWILSKIFTLLVVTFLSKPPRGRPGSLGSGHTDLNAPSLNFWSG